MLAAALLVVAVALSYFLWRCCTCGKRNLPPGPRPLPFIGHLHLASRYNLPKTYISLAEQYGDIFSFKLGFCDLIVVTGYEKIIELKRKKAADFSGRARHFLMDGTQNEGLLWSSGESWKMCKNMTMSALKDMNRRGGVENRIIDEANELKSALSNCMITENGTVDVRPLLANAVANIVASISFGYRFEYDDSEFQTLLKLMDDYTGHAAGNLVTAFPFLRFLPGDLFNFYKLVNFGKKLNDYTKNKIRTRLSTLQHEHLSGDKNTQSEKCMIDYYLADKLTRSQDEPSLDEDNFAVLLKDLFLAGTETASNTVSWGLLLFAHNQPLQDALRKEIELCAEGQSLNMANLNKSQFIKAVIAELHRRAAVSAYGSPPIYMDNDSELGGYDIPAGSVLVTCLHTIHLNERYYPDPLEFNPYRFLDKDGQFKRPEKLLPFGAGPRSCPADFVGHMEVVLYLCYLIQSFKFTLLDCTETASTQGVVGLTHTPPDFKLKVERISDN